MIGNFFLFFFFYILNGLMFETVDLHLPEMVLEEQWEIVKPFKR